MVWPHPDGVVAPLTERNSAAEGIEATEYDHVLPLTPVLGKRMLGRLGDDVVNAVPDQPEAEDQGHEDDDLVGMGIDPGLPDDIALRLTPDKLIGTLAWLAAAYGALAEPRTAAAAQIIARARSGWPVPAWLDHWLSLVESRVYTAAGDIQAALAAARRASDGNSPEGAVTLARAWVAAGDAQNAARALAPVLATDREAPDRLRLQAWLVDAQLCYQSGDRARGRSRSANASGRCYGTCQAC